MSVIIMLQFVYTLQIGAAKHGNNGAWIRRDIVIEDRLHRVTVKFWNEMSRLLENVRTGVTIRIKNLSTHVFHNVVFLDSTDQTSLEMVSIYALIMSVIIDS